MLQTIQLREQRDSIIQLLEKRCIDVKPLIDEAIKLDEKRRKLQFDLDNALAESNKLSKNIGKLFKSGNQEEANALKDKTTSLKSLSKQLAEDLEQTSIKLTEILYKIPNVPHQSVPKGKTEDDNDLILEKGEKPNLLKDALPHWELAKKYDIISFDLGNKITGAGFPVYKDKGARLQRALINYFLDKNTKAGYTEYQPPLIINEASGYGTGQLPDKEGQMYHISVDDLYLIPTSEVPITNLFRGDLFKESDFPICCTSYTPCFRRESGSYGSHVRGLNRLHQFDKVEIVRIEHPDNSYKALDGMVSHIEELLQELNLPYRILRLCGGDLGFTSALTYDFEVFSTAQDRWLEVSSVSNFESFQANRLKLRYKNTEGKTNLAHTLNGSALALPRVLAALLENNQTTEGITIPKVLQPYTMFSIIS